MKNIFYIILTLLFFSSCVTKSVTTKEKTITIKDTIISKADTFRNKVVFNDTMYICTPKYESTLIVKNDTLFERTIIKSDTIFYTKEVPTYTKIVKKEDLKWSLFLAIICILSFFVFLIKDKR